MAQATTIQVGKKYSFVTNKPGRLIYRDQWINKNNSTNIYEVTVEAEVSLEDVTDGFEDGNPAICNFVISYATGGSLYKDAFYVKDSRGIGHMVASEELHEI
jgi:hypothetical protein